MRRRYRQVLTTLAPHRVDMCLAGAIFVAAFVLRIVQLVELPPGLHGDEAWTGLRARSILEGHLFGGFDRVHGLGQPSGMEYLTAAFVAIAGNSILTVRLPMAFLGAATVPLTYALVRTSAPRSTAAFAALILAVMGWHLHFSRIALPPASLPFFEVLAAVLLIVALRRCESWLFVAAGAAAGLGVYSYSSYTFFFFVLAAFLAYWLAFRVERIDRVLRIHLAVAALVAIMVMIPMAQSIYVNQQRYFDYPREISLFNNEEYEDASGFRDKADVVLDAGRDFVRRMILDANPDGSDATGTGPMLDAPLSALLGIGIVYALWSWRRQPLGVLALLAIVVLPWAGILTTGGGVVRRAFGVTPFVAILAALPLGALVERLQRPTLRLGAYALALSAITLIAVLDIRAYYGPFRHSAVARSVFAPQLVAASNYLDDLPSGTQVYFYSDQWSIDYETVRYLAPAVTGEDRSKFFTGRVSYETNRKEDVTYVLLDPYLDDIAEIERLYPGGTTFVGKSGGEQPHFIAYHLPRLKPGETPIAPLPTFVPTPTQTVQPGGDDRDRQRQLAFAQLQEALEQYHAKHGSYPDNDGGVQSLCSFSDIDAGCALEEVLDEIPRDPLEGEGSVVGYFYSSDGDTYTVYAYRETEAYAECPEKPEHLGGLASVMCMHGP